MSSAFLIVATLTYGLTLWLGLYLITRASRQPGIVLAGSGLVVYALAVGADILLWSPVLTDPLLLNQALESSGWWRASLILHLLPAILWVGALFYLLPRTPLHPRPARGIILVAGLFFALGMALFLIPISGLSPVWIYLFIGLDVVALGVTIAWLDAFNQGETLLPDIIRSCDAALIAALVFGGQVALAMVFSVGVTPPMLMLLLATLATAIALVTLADSLQSLVDRFALARFPGLRAARADLRAAARELPRVTANVNLAALDETEFTRLVRRALTHYGDLPRLAASPLTYLPHIDRRLAQAGMAHDDPLERAAQLKLLLAESIARLKPRTGDDFGITDEWRHYNALYFPYVVGLKPYSRRAYANGLDPTARAAFEWFQSQIPERTLYNWQSAAARLIAQDLRERAGHQE